MDTLQDLLTRIGAEQATQPNPDQLETLTSLVRQNMTSGLGVNEQGNLQYDMPAFNRAAGYAGPMRESDKPSLIAAADIPVYNGAKLSPQTLEAQLMAGGPLRSVLPADKAQQMGSGMQAMQAAGMPAAVQGSVVQNLLQSMGIGPDKFKDAFAEARGKALGELAGGGGKRNIPSDVMRAIGTEKFHDLVDKGIASGDIDAKQQMQLEARHQAAWAKGTPSEKAVLTLASVRTSADALDRLKKAYEETEAAKTGRMSSTFKIALARTVAGASGTELLPFLDKLTPEERRYVAEANTFSINLRNVSQDSRFSNFDSQKVLQAVGNPLMGRDLYMDQLDSSGKELYRRYDNTVKALKGAGKRVDEFAREEAQPAAKSGATGTWKVEVEK